MTPNYVLTALPKSFIWCALYLYCTSFQRCFLNLCSGSSLFSCWLFQQLCHLFNEHNRRLYPDDCTRLLYSSFGFFCFWLLACTTSWGFQCRDGPIFLPANKNGYRCPGVPACRQWTFLNGGRKIQDFLDVSTCSWIINSRRFGGSHAFLAEQFNLERPDPEGIFINLLTALFVLYQDIHFYDVTLFQWYYGKLQ